MSRTELRTVLRTHMKPYKSVGVGVCFMAYLFAGLVGVEPREVFDAAYEYACEIMQVHEVDVVKEGGWVRFVPQIAGGEL